MLTKTSSFLAASMLLGLGGIVAAEPAFVALHGSWNRARRTGYKAACATACRPASTMIS